MVSLCEVNSYKIFLSTFKLVFDQNNNLISIHMIIAFCQAILFWERRKLNNGARQKWLFYAYDYAIVFVIPFLSHFAAFKISIFIRSLEFGPPADKKVICSTILSATSLYPDKGQVLDSISITLEEQDSLERVQKVSLKIILKSKYTDYDHALKKTKLESLKTRRERLCLKFAKNLYQAWKT